MAVDVDTHALSLPDLRTLLHEMEAFVLDTAAGTGDLLAVIGGRGGR